MKLRQGSGNKFNFTSLMARQLSGEVCWVTMGHLRVTVGHLRVTIGHFRVNVGHLRVTKGHLRVTMGHLRFTIGDLNSLLPRIDFSNLECHKTYFLVSWG